MRGLPDVSFILLDEADFFPIGQLQEARVVSERYIAKSNPWIVMVLTPNAPDSLFEKIERTRRRLPIQTAIPRLYTSVFSPELALFIAFRILSRTQTLERRANEDGTSILVCPSGYSMN